MIIFLKSLLSKESPFINTYQGRPDRGISGRSVYNSVLEFSRKSKFINPSIYSY